MADEAKRDAKLTLKFETSEAVRGMKDVERAGEKVTAQQRSIRTEAERTTKAIADQGRAAEAAARTIERYGSETLSRPESRQARAAARRIDREHDAAIKRVEEYRLDKYYQGVRAQRREAQEAAASRAAAPGLVGTALSLAAPYLTFQAFLKAMENATEQINIRNNVSLTAAQKRDAVLDDVSFGVTTTVRGFVYALTGVSEALRQTHLRIERDNAIIGGQARNASDRFGASQAASEARRRREAYAGATVSPMGQYDRSSVAGEIGYQEELRRVGASDAYLEAQRQAKGARGTSADAENALAKINRQVDASRGRMDAAQGRYADLVKLENGRPDTRSGVSRFLGWTGVGFANAATRFAGNQTDPNGLRNQHGRASALADLNKETREFESLIELRGRAIDRARDTAVSASQAEANARQRNIDVMRTELEISEARTNRLIGAAERFGAMNPLEQQIAAGSLIAFNEHGPRGVTPEMMSMASALNPDLVRMRQRQLAETDPAFTDLRQRGLIGEGTRGSIAENQRETEKLREGLREATLANQQRLVDDASSAMGLALERLLKSFTDRLKAIEAKLANSQQTQFNSQK